MADTFISFTCFVLRAHVQRLLRTTSLALEAASSQFINRTAQFPDHITCRDTNTS